MKLKYYSILYDLGIFGLVIYLNQDLYAFIFIPSVFIFLYLQFKIPSDKKLKVFNFIENRLNPAVLVLGGIVVIVSFFKKVSTTALYSTSEINEIGIPTAIVDLMGFFILFAAMLYLIIILFKVWYLYILRQ